MTSALTEYLRDVRARDNDEHLKPQIEIAYEAWTKRVYEEDAMLSTQFAFRNGYRAGFYASYRTDVPRLVAMFDKAFEFIEGAGCWCEIAMSAGYKQCTKCDALANIEQIARGSQ